jgi:ribosomal protein L15
MCRPEHEHRTDDEQGSEHEGRGRGHHRGSGFRGGFGRRGFPSSEQWLERLQAHEQRLQEDLKNVQELIGRLAAPPAPATEG